MRVRPSALWIRIGRLSFQKANQLDPFIIDTANESRLHIQVPGCYRRWRHSLFGSRGYSVFIDQRHVVDLHAEVIDRLLVVLASALVGKLSQFNPTPLAIDEMSARQAHRLFFPVGHTLASLPVRFELEAERLLSE